MLTEPGLTRPIDTHGAGNLLDHTTIPSADQQAAARYLDRHCEDAGDLRAMLGLGGAA